MNQLHYLFDAVQSGVINEGDVAFPRWKWVGVIHGEGQTRPIVVYGAMHDAALVADGGKVSTCLRVGDERHQLPFKVEIQLQDKRKKNH